MLEKVRPGGFQVDLTGTDCINQQDNANTKICIVCPSAYPLLAGSNLEIVGGAELQSVLLSREFRRQGFDVSFIVYDFGQQSREVIEEIEVFKIYPFGAPKGISFKKVRLLWRALCQANADIYYGFAGIVGIVAFYCLLKRKRLVICIAKEKEVQDKPISRRDTYDWLWRFDLKRANCVIAQTKYQQELLESNFGRHSIIIKAYHPIESEAIQKDIPPIVMWAARIGPQLKQPEVFLQLAGAIPDAKFQMIGGPSGDNDLYERIKAQASHIPNLDFVGFIPHHKMGEYFGRASIFVSTSIAEGFSNTFLEAWSRHTPVVSLNVDPDEIICENKLGFHSRTFEQMVLDVRRLLDDERLRRELGENGRRYVEQEHDPNRVVEQYIGLFNQLISSDK